MSKSESGLSATYYMKTLLANCASAQRKLCTSVPRGGVTSAGLGLGLGLGPEAGLWCVAGNGWDSGILISCFTVYHLRYLLC